jgi:hypothetical protein
MDFYGLFFCGVLPALCSISLLFFKPEKNPENKPESNETRLVRRLAAIIVGLACILEIIRYSCGLPHKVSRLLDSTSLFVNGIGLGMIISVGIYHGWSKRKLPTLGPTKWGYAAWKERF